MIALRESEGLSNLIIQVDTLCHLIPNSVEKAGRRSPDLVDLRAGLRGRGARASRDPRDGIRAVC